MGHRECLNLTCRLHTRIDSPWQLSPIARLPNKALPERVSHPPLYLKKLDKTLRAVALSRCLPNLSTKYIKLLDPSKKKMHRGEDGTFLSPYSTPSVPPPFIPGPATPLHFPAESASFWEIMKEGNRKVCDHANP